MLAGFHRRADLKRFAARLADSGIAGTETRFRFFAETAFWLARRYPQHLQVDWAELSEKQVGVQPGMPAFDEETFGPVAAVIRANDEAEAIRLANQSVYGVGAAVFTADTARGERVAYELEAGCCFVNDFVRSDPRLPFGGVKDSGCGRELGRAGLREFVNVKTVMIR